MNKYTWIAFDRRTTSAQELLRQVQAERISKANPKMQLNVDIIGTVDPPQVKFEFVDGTKVRIFYFHPYYSEDMFNSFV